MFFAIGGVWELDVPLVVHPLSGSFVFLDMGPFIFVLCIISFLGALVYL
jgi:hypothetical protein